MAGAGEPISVLDRSDTGGTLGARSAASGAALGRRAALSIGVGGDELISVCAWRRSSSSEVGADGGTLRGKVTASGARGTTDSGFVAMGGTERRAAAGSERGAGATRVTSSLLESSLLGSSAEPQSVSISSVTGGTEGGIGRGGSLTVARGGTDDACP